VPHTYHPVTRTPQSESRNSHPETRNPQPAARTPYYFEKSLQFFFKTADIKNQDSNHITCLPFKKREAK